MTALLNKNHRVATAPWRKTFKREWMSLLSSRVGSEEVSEHHTDPLKWTCACREFLLSRLLICKHIVSCFEEFSDTIRFFSEVHRQRNCPFWIHQQLVICPEYSIEEPELYKSNDDIESVTGNYTDSEGESEPVVESESEEDNLDNIEDSSSSDDSEDALTSNSAYLDILKEHKEIGNKKLLKVFKVIDTKNLQFLAEVRRRKGQRTTPRAWDQNNHPATMYYR